MTCIIGVVSDGDVYIGGDSFFGHYQIRHIEAAGKVFAVGATIWGWCGSARISQVIEHALSLPDRTEGEGDGAFMFRLAEAARLTIKDHAATTEKDGTSSTGESDALVGYRGKLYLFNGDFAVVELGRGYAAVGSGQPYAEGALHALVDVDAPTRIAKALAAAADLCPTVCGPMSIFSLRGGKIERVGMEIP